MPSFKFRENAKVLEGGFGLLRGKGRRSSTPNGLKLLKCNLQGYLTTRLLNCITLREEHFACIYVFIYMYPNDLTYYAVNSTRSVFAGAWFDPQTVFVHVKYL